MNPVAAAESEIDLEHQSFSMAYRKPLYPVTVMMPYVDGIRGPVVASLLYYAKHLDVGFELVGNTLLSGARNELAARFLRSKAQWSFWLDSDVFIPYGEADTYLSYTHTSKGRSFAQHNTLVRLLSHDYPLVGGVYAGRFRGAPLTIQPDLNPRSPNDQQIAESLREGRTAGGLQPVDWIAAGLMLAHRRVFERIMEQMPVKPSFPGELYPFFTHIEGVPGGEDMAFCYRATKVGLRPMLDTEVRAGHIGLSMFLAEDSKPPLPLRGRNGLA